MPITFQRDSSVTAIHAQSSAARATAAFSTSDPADPFISGKAAIAAALEGVAHAIGAAKADLKPEAVTRKVRSELGKALPQPAAALVEAIGAKRANYAATLARHSAPPADAVLASEDRAAFRAVPVAERYRWIKRADRDALAAVISVGRDRWSEIDDAVWQAATDRLVKLSWIAETGQQARFSLTPTPEQPARSGPDLAAAEAHAETALAALQSDLDAADRAERFLADVVNVVAVAGEITVADAFALVAGSA